MTGDEVMVARGSGVIRKGPMLKETRQPLGAEKGRAPLMLLEETQPSQHLDV